MGNENPVTEAAKDIVKGGFANLEQILSKTFPYWGLKKEAVNTYIHEINNSNLSVELKAALILGIPKEFRKIQHQSAILDAAYSALISKHGENFIPPPISNDELVERLLASGKYVSDENIQALWGNVLAGELDEPGSTPKNIVRILSELEKCHAEVFSNLCSLRIDILTSASHDLSICDSELMIFNDAAYLRELHITSNTLMELDNLGLINFDRIKESFYEIRQTDYPYIHLVSGESVITVIKKNYTLPIGRVSFTTAGKCIARFVPKTCNQQHISAIKSCLKERGIEILENTTLHITTTGAEETGMGYNCEML